MKKNLLFVALTGAALVSSCVSDEVVNIQEQQKQVKIGFSSPVLYENAESRAWKFGEITGHYTYTGSVGNYTYPREESFRIFAVNHPGDFISWDHTSNVSVKFNGDSIKYDSRVDAWAPKQKNDQGEEIANGYYYWPSGKMSFAAMSPATLSQNPTKQFTVEYKDNGLSITDFVTPEIDKQFDLMFSKREINKTSSNMSNLGAGAYSGIPLLFYHALTSIHFSLKVDPTVTKDIYLTKITVSNVESKASFCENVDENLTDDYVLGETVKPEWTLSKNYLKDYVPFEGNLLFPFEAQYVSALAASDVDLEDEIEKSHALLLIPQSFYREYAKDSEGTVQDLKIKVDYIVGETPRSKEFKVKDYPQVENRSQLTAWERGVRYTYRLYYTEASEKTDMIYFAPSTDGWVEEAVIEVKL